MVRLVEMVRGKKIKNRMRFLKIIRFSRVGRKQFFWDGPIIEKTNQRFEI